MTSVAMRKLRAAALAQEAAERATDQHTRQMWTNYAHQLHREAQRALHVQ